MYSPGYFRADLAPGRSVTLIATCESWETAHALPPNESERAEHLFVERDRTLDVGTDEVDVPESEEHYVPLFRSSATIAGTISCRSPITAQSARATIGAFWSLLITRIRFAPLQPTRCWIAPLTPHAM